MPAERVVDVLSLAGTHKDNAPSLYIITGHGGDRDNIHIGHREETVWYRHMDVDGDGVMDTVLYDNATGDGGIYAILEDYSDPLKAGDFFGSGIIITEIT